MRSPNFKKAHGTMPSARAKNPSKLPAQCTPNVLYILAAANGNEAPKMLLVQVAAAITDAA
jgi:hypothetical protein